MKDTRDAPKTDDVQSNRWNEAFEYLCVEIKRNLQQPHSVCNQEQHDGNNKLRKQEEKRHVGFVEYPFVT